MQEFNFKDGDRVSFTSPLVGEGIIRGCSTNPVPILGSGYIVDVIKSEPTLPTEEYPFKMIVVFENAVQRLDTHE